MGQLLKFEVTHHSLHLYGKPTLDEQGACNQCGKEIE